MNHAKLITISGLAILVMSLAVGLLYVQDRLTITTPAQTISEDSCLLGGGSIVADPGSCPSGNTVQIDYGSGTESSSPDSSLGGSEPSGGGTSPNGGTTGNQIAYCCRLPEEPVEPETPAEEPGVDPTTPPEPTKVPDSPTPEPPSEAPNPPTPVPSPTAPPSSGEPTVPPDGDPPTSTPEPAITDSGPSPTPNDGGGDTDGTSGDSCEIPAFTVTTKVKDCFNCINQ